MSKAKGNMSKLSKTRQEELRETHNYLEKLLDYANAPIIVWDPAFRIVQFNHAFEYLSGYTADEVIGKELHILLPEESRDESLRMIALTSSGEYWESVEIPILCKDGDIRIVLWNSANICAENGKTLLSTIAQGQDITERKRTEEEIKKSEQKFKAIFDNAIDGILLADMETKKFYDGNKMICQMLGYSLEEIKTLGVFDIHPEKDLPHVIEQFEKQARKEITLAKDIPLKRKDGSVFYADINSAPVTLSGKAYLMGIFRDITERKKSGEELKKRVDELERFRKATVQREFRMKELKDEIQYLRLKIQELEKSKT